MSDDSRWRLLLGLGAIPSSFVVVCSVLESRAAASAAKHDDMTTHALLHPTHADEFHHHPDGGIGQSSHGSGSSGSSPFHDSFGAGSLGRSAPAQTKGAAADSHFSAFLKQPGAWMKILVTGGGWFIYDVAYCKLPLHCAYCFLSFSHILMYFLPQTA